jgi:hypothetical protein
MKKEREAGGENWREAQGQEGPHGSSLHMASFACHRVTCGLNPNLNIAKKFEKIMHVHSTY